MEYKKKLIEVALPLEAINKACSKEKSIRHGHISTLHLYWARRPLSSARAVIFSSLIDDPSNNKDLSEDEVLKERNRLFKIIEQLVLWKNENNQSLLGSVKHEINKSTNNQPPVFLDPFAGGGAIPYEAQKLGLKSYASDLNPVSVVINKAQIEIPAMVKDLNPINPESKNKIASFSNAQGLAEDFNYYSKIVYKKAFERLSKYYPKSKNGESVIGWYWSRTVECSNPACSSVIPMLSNNVLVNKKNRKVWLKHKLDGNSVTFQVTESMDVTEDSPKTGRGANFKCYHCHTISNSNYIKEKSKKKALGFQMIAKICNSGSKKTYYNIEEKDLEIFNQAQPEWTLDESMDENNPTLVSGRGYGINNWNEIFLSRQMLSLTVFVEEIKTIKDLSISHGASEEYANSLVVHLSMCFDRFLNRMTSFCRYHTGRESIEGALGRQMLPMIFDFVESNPFSEKTGSWISAISWSIKILNSSLINAAGYVDQIDARKAIYDLECPLIITDPPYYDNIMYADLSDFYYVWLKKLLKDIYPEIFATIKTPKTPEITANKHLYGGDSTKANEHFLNGLSDAAKLIADKANPNFPIIYYYAFKQSETDKGGTASTGWETFLEGLIKTNCQITATWPIRTEMVTGLVGGTNVLSSSIIIAVRKRNHDGNIATRKEFIKDLSLELEKSLLEMLQSNISPVDIQQSIIGPGMAVFTRYAKVLEADGGPMTVRTALQIINSELDRIQENSDIEMDSDTRFCIQWFDTYGYDEKTYGEAETLARAKDISVQGLVNSGVFEADSGKAKLKHWSKMPTDWDPRTDNRLTLWECTHHMVRELVNGDGQLGAAKLAKFMGPQKADEAKELAYQLYHICDKRSWAKHAGDYNTLVSNWADIKSQIPNVSEGQETLF
ncbi:MAG: DUF1156 domain-containing protein [Candidatus Brocadiales bacterium]|nr:DUF1156 domain-containing protein [Candidatus Brocadiales bacterium]